MLNKRDLDELVRMLEGNIARLVMSDDLTELESMREWAHQRIDWITKYRLQQINKTK